MPHRSKWLDPKYSRIARARRRLDFNVTVDQPLITEFFDPGPALQTISTNRELARRLSLFAQPDCQDREVKGASHFLKMLIKLTEQNADRSPFGRRLVFSIFIL